MNGMIEPLPGLLDDPQFQLPDLPAFNDFHIAPLRDPAPQRFNNAPAPLEPVTANTINASRNPRHAPQSDELPKHRKTPNITPNDVLDARDFKKPHLAISEIIEHHDGPDSTPVQLPSFVSLSVVEKSPVQASSSITSSHVSKRPRLDQDTDLGTHDFGRQLPRPAHKELPHSRPAPLLPAMVTGLHEPPPSAALLPSMDPDKRPSPTRTASVKIQVKDILMSDDSDMSAATRSVPLLAVGEPVPVKQATGIGVEQPSRAEVVQVQPSIINSTMEGKEGKTRRARRKWTDAETQGLLRGVEKHGIGKWKQILEDGSFSFTDRTTVDLKDRYRVSGKEKEESIVAERIVKSGRPEDTTNPVQNGQAIQRRKRRAWTPGEDDRLIKGIQKYGFQWTNIHDDPELELMHRRATDLRDRIRNKYPEGYKQAESAPLRSEVKKAEKSKGGKKRSNDEATDEPVTKEKEQNANPGLTLPSLTFDEDDVMDWDNRLPPLLEWDDL